MNPEINVRLSVNAGAFVAGVNNAARSLDQVDEANRRVDRSAAAATDSSTRLVGALQKMGHYGLGGSVLAALAYQAYAMTRAMYDASASAQRLGTQLNFATGGNAPREMAYVSSLANKLGLEINSTAKAYAGFAAAAKGTRIEGVGARDVFTAMAKASAVMGLSADETSGALLAVQQMMSKGVVSAEEFRGQLGERMPIALQAGADALGVTTAEFSKLLESGKIISADFLPKFADAITRALGDAPEQAAQRLDAVTARAKNAFSELLRTVGDSGVSAASGTVMAALTNDMTAFSQAMQISARAGGGFVSQVNNGVGILIGRAFGLQGINRDFLTLQESAADAAATIARLDQQEIASGKLSIYAMAERAEAVRDLARANRELAASGVIQGGGGGRGFANPQTVAGAAADADAEQRRREAITGEFKAAFASPTEKASQAVDEWKKKLGDLFTPDMEGKIRAHFVKPTEAGVSLAKRYGDLVSDLLARGDGLNTDYAEKIALLTTGYAATSKSTEATRRYHDALAALEARQPRALEAERASRQARESAARSADGSASQVAQRVQSLRDEEAALALSASAHMSLARAVEEVAIARLREQQDAARAAGNLDVVDAIHREISARRELAGLTERKDQRQTDGRASEAADKRLQDYLGKDIGTDLAAGFDKASQSLGAFAQAFGRLTDQQAAYRQAVKDAGGDSEKLASVEARDLRARLNSYGSLAGSAKGFFKEQTAGYKLLATTEKAYRAYEMAAALGNAAEKMGLLAAFTTAKVAATGAEATATVAGQGVETAAVTAGEAARNAAKVPGVFMAFMSALGPWGMAAAGAAVAAVLGGAFGGGGGGAAIPTNDGTGTVLGDPSAQSKSIANSIDALKDVDTMTMRYSAGMLAALNSIEANIGGLSSLLVRSGAIDSAAAGIKTGTRADVAGNLLLGGVYAGGLLLTNKLAGSVAGLLNQIPVIGGLLGGLAGAAGNLAGKVASFVSSSSTSIKGQGIYGGAQSLAAIAANGYQASLYADTETKKKTFGFSSGTSQDTRFGAADAELNRQMSLIFDGFADAVKAAAGPLGLSLNDVSGRINGFVVDIGKINLLGLTGDQISEKLSAVFSSEGDKIARAVLPGFDDFTRVGEGYFETVTRVATGSELASAALERLGLSAVSLAGLANKQGDVGAELVRETLLAREAASGIGQIIETLSGTASDLASAYKALTDVRLSLELLGLSGAAVSRALLQGAGGLDALQSGVQDYEEGFFTEAEQLSVKTGRLRAEFARLGVAMPVGKSGFRALVEGIDTSTDAGQKLLGSLLPLARSFADIADAASQAGQGIADEIARLRGLGGAAGGNGSLASLRTQFAVATAQARAGDVAALDKLPELSRGISDLAATLATDRLDLSRTQAGLANSLDETLAIVRGSALPVGAPLPVPAAGPGVQTGQAEQTAQAQAALLDQMRQVKDTMVRVGDYLEGGNANVAGVMSRMLGVFQRIAPDDAMQTRAVS